MLQKPQVKSKTKVHSTHLERKLKLCEKWNINLLMIEGRTIQHQLKKRIKQNGVNPDGQKAHILAKLMTEGKLKAALYMLAQDSNGGVFSLNKDVFETLKKKHPARKPAIPSMGSHYVQLFSQDPSHFILFNLLDGQMMRKTVDRRNSWPLQP